MADSSPLSPQAPLLFVSHGAGPAIFIKPEDVPSPLFLEFGPNSAPHKQLMALPKQLPVSFTPKAILVISAHFETTSTIHVTGRDSYPELLHDFGNFATYPEYVYKVEYRAPGNSELAKRIVDRLNGDGHTAKLDMDRNWDHGVFVPLTVMFPEANIPVVSLSILSDLDPKKHVEIGRSLRWLRDEGVLIIGSGGSTHNLSPNSSAESVQAFANALEKALVETHGEERENVLANWTQLPGARGAHPCEDHLIPLHVVVGAAGDSHAVSASRFVSMSGAFDFSNYIFSAD